MVKGATFLKTGQIKAVVAEVERALICKGRVLLRPPRTEPLLRMIVEGENGALVAQCAERIAGVVR